MPMSASTPTPGPVRPVWARRSRAASAGPGRLAAAGGGRGRLARQREQTRAELGVAAAAAGGDGRRSGGERAPEDVVVVADRLRREPGITYAVVGDGPLAGSLLDLAGFLASTRSGCCGRGTRSRSWRPPPIWCSIRRRAGGRPLLAARWRQAAGGDGPRRRRRAPPRRDRGRVVVGSIAPRMSSQRGARDAGGRRRPAAAARARSSPVSAWPGRRSSGAPCSGR